MAYSNLPIRRPIAPVKAPCSCPNSSLSRMLPGRAEMLSGTKGLLLRGLFWCSARATSSLPVPLSPWISTVLSVGATKTKRLDDPVHLGAGADDPLEAEFLVEPAVELGVAADQADAGRRFLDRRAQLADIERFGEVGVGAVLHGRDGRIDRAVPRDDDDFRVGQLLLGLGEDLQAVDFVHFHVGDDDVEVLAFDQRDAPLAGVGDRASRSRCVRGSGRRPGRGPRRRRRSGREWGCRTGRRDRRFSSWDS